MNDRKALKHWEQFVAWTRDSEPAQVSNSCDPVSNNCATPRKRPGNKPLIINIICCSHADEKNCGETCAKSLENKIREIFCERDR